MSLDSTSIREFKYENPVNKPVEPIITVWIIHAGGYTFPREVHFDNLEKYNNDPDAYAACFFGIDSVHDYREWCAFGGIPYCGAMTKTGKSCQNIVQGYDRLALDFSEWKNEHRHGFCALHARRGK